MSKGVVFPAILLLCLSGVALSGSWMERQARTERMSEMPWLAEMDPVDFLGTTALGGLRPLLIDLLAMRAQDAFARRDWFEALAISNLLCRLQPNLPAAWESNSWNMAYNIAASKREAEKPEEEFAWVMQGIEFMKKGIRKNPDSSQAYWWLSFMVDDKGRYPEYAPGFQAAGFDPSVESIRAARESARLETVGYRSRHWLAILLHKKMVELLSAEPAKIEEALPLAREGREALEKALKWVPEEKDFREFREGIDARISFFEKVLGSTKVQEGKETKKAGDN